MLWQSNHHHHPICTRSQTFSPQGLSTPFYAVFLFLTCSLHPTQLLKLHKHKTHFITEASLRNSLRSLSVACSFTVLIAQRISGCPSTTSRTMPSYTIPKLPCPSSRSSSTFFRGTSHSSGSYTVEETDTAHITYCLSHQWTLCIIPHWQQNAQENIWQSMWWDSRSQ